MSSFARSIVTNRALTSAPPARGQVMVMRVYWKDILQTAEEIDISSSKTTAYHIGEDPNCRFIIPKEYLGSLDRFNLAEVVGSGLTVHYQAHMLTAIREPAGTVTPLHPATSDQQAGTYVAGQNETVLVALGPWRFEVNIEEKAERVKAPLSIDRRFGYFFGFSMVLHAVILGVFYLVPPDAAGFSFDDSRETNQFVKVMLGVQEATEAIRPETPQEDQKSESISGTAHTGVMGEMGDRTAVRTNKRSAIKGPPDNQDLHMKREMLKEKAALSGVLALLTAQNMPVSPFGMDTAKGFDPENALGALVGDEIGVNFGMGGLGPKGTGRGGGGSGEGTIGSGSFGRLAWSRLRGNCTGPECGFGMGRGRLSGRSKAKVKLKSTGTTVLGSLSKETIRRIVRRHLNEIKFCYERELQKHPDLSGRVSIKFLIDGHGVVKSAVVANSTIANANVDQCIVGTVRRMTFPSPENNGVVIVTYPFALSSADG